MELYYRFIFIIIFIFYQYLTYNGSYIIPSCTSYGTIDATMRISDATVMLHRPRNCTYLIEFAFRRRMTLSSEERTGSIRGCNVYFTSMDASNVFIDLVYAIGEAVLQAIDDGFHTIFLVPTCSTKIMGTDLSIPARFLSERHGLKIFSI